MDASRRVQILRVASACWLVLVALLNSCHYQHLLVNIVSVEINCDIISDRADKIVCSIKMAKFTSLIGGLFLSSYINCDIYYFR